MQKVVIINKFGPSSKSITGRSARSLADYLISAGHKVSFISLDAEYKMKKRVEENDFKGESIKLKSLYNGNKPILRLIFSLLDGLRLIRRSNQQNFDHRIIMTDPPLLYFWASFFKKKGRSEVYWTMDLYPEAFVSGNYISSSNFIYKFILNKVYSHKPDILITLGVNQGLYLDKKFGLQIPKIVLPCGIIDFKLDKTLPTWKKENPNKIIFGYGGNISEAHDANFLITFINCLDSNLHRIVLSLYGSKKNVVLNSIKNSTVVIYVDNISYSDQHYIDVNLASLLPVWDNVCVPSKAVTAICCQSSLLINSSNVSEAWNMFSDSSWLVEYGSNYTESIKKFLRSLNHNEIEKRRSVSVLIAEKMLALESYAYNELNSFLVPKNQKKIHQ